MTHASMYKSIHMAIWNGCHIRQYSINFDWFYWLSLFTELELTIFLSYYRSLTPTPQKTLLVTKQQVYIASPDRNYNLTLHLIHGFQIYTGITEFMW